MNSDRLKLGRFAGAFVVCLALLAGSGCGRPQDAQSKNNPYTALGEIMAVKLNDLAGGKGSVVLVVAQSDNGQPTAIGQAITTFRNTLSKSIRISATETVTARAVLPPGYEPLSPSKFSELLQKYPDTDYLVSFVGVPVLTPSQISQLPARRPQAVEVITFRAPARAMFANKVVCLAAISRQVPDQSAAGRPAQELFDAQYQIITPENTGALPY